jgi:hypothetical protein
MPGSHQKKNNRTMKPSTRTVGKAADVQNTSKMCLVSHHKTTTAGHNINLLKPTGHMMHQQLNIQQLYVLPTLYLCVLYLSQNKQRLVPLTS